MASSPGPVDRTPQELELVFGRTRTLLFAILLVLFSLCLLFAWTTRDAMQHRPAMYRTGNVDVPGGGDSLVDETPWQTAQTLAAMAVTAEENAYALEAERLADHDVDQAFAAALRAATLRAQHRPLAGRALVIAQKIAQLQQEVAQDQATVQKLTAAQPSAARGSAADSEDASEGSDLDIAKAQLALDSDELADAERALDRATGDQRAAIQNELEAREQSMKKYDAQIENDGQPTVLSVSKYSTLARRLAAWNKQRARLALIQQAQQQALTTVASLTAQYNTLEQAANAAAPQGANVALQDRGTRLASIKDRSQQRQLLGIYEDRIQTEEQLASVYGKWAAQVQLQHRILLHLILQSLAWVILILICMVLGDGLVRRLTEHPRLERRQRHTLRAILELAIQLGGVLCILLVIFGPPQQTSTMIGLTTAALTIALQDFVLAFFGWFVLMGKKGMRVGDSVEIEGVGGEVTEIGLMSTTLFETGPLSEHGYPTGRRISFMNGFAIRGKYFNFSTAGQWMIDHFEVAIPAGDSTHDMTEGILQAITEETATDAGLAEQEWKRALRDNGALKMRASADVHLRPSGGGFTLEIRYVTRASDRTETRNRLYRRVIDLLNAAAGSETQPIANKDSV